MISETNLVLFVLVLARVSTFVAFFPLFSKRQIPRMVKVGMSASLAFFWYSFLVGTPAAEEMTSGDVGLISSLMLIVREVTIGMVLAIALGLFFLPAKVAGSYVGQEMGLSLASISDPGTQDSSTLVTRIFEAFSILIFFSINLHHFLILVVHTSFETLQGKVEIFNLPTEQLVTMLNDVSDYGFLIIAPIAIIFMVVTVGLAFLNKAAPTLNVFSIGMPLRIGLGIFCLILFLPVIFGSVEAYLYRVQEDVEQLLVVMGR